MGLGRRGLGRARLPAEPLTGRRIRALAREVLDGDGFVRWPSISLVTSNTGIRTAGRSEEMKDKKRNSISAACILSLVLLSTSAGAQINSGVMSPPANTRPPRLENVGIEQHLDAQVPPDLVFRDDTGKTVKLGDYFGHKPLILNLVYYNCTMLCGEALAGLASAMRLVKFDVGKEFDVITVSFDPRETPEMGRGLQPWRTHSVRGRQPHELYLAESGGFPQQWHARPRGGHALRVCRAARQRERLFPTAAELHAPPSARDLLPFCGR